jgi:hypothetical protein
MANASWASGTRDRADVGPYFIALQMARAEVANMGIGGGGQRHIQRYCRSLRMVCFARRVLLRQLGSCVLFLGQADSFHRSESERYPLWISNCKHLL